MMEKLNKQTNKQSVRSIQKSVEKGALFSKFLRAPYAIRDIECEYYRIIVGVSHKWLHKLLS